MRFQYELIPERIMEALLRYRKNGCPTGSFTEAALSGDLYDACRRADDEVILVIPTIVCWIENNMPSVAYGSRALYKNWVKRFDDLHKEGFLQAEYNHEHGNVIKGAQTAQEKETVAD